jgi:nucleotide-binding universal stress UspA family protein
MKNILVPTDFSVESQHAYAMALRVAGHSRGHVTLLHVLKAPQHQEKPTAVAADDLGQLPEPELKASPVADSERLQAARRQLLAFKNATDELPSGVRVTDAVAVGRVGESILDTIERCGIDLVVIGAQGRGTLQRFFVGSNTRRLIRRTACPVLTVKNPPQSEFAVRNILFPSDFSEELPIGSGGLRQVQAAFPEATLHLLHVRNKLNHDVVLQRMRAFAERAGLRNVHTNVVHAGNAAVGIAQYAQQVGADLVVIPTHGRSGVNGLLRTSIAETVATHALPPVLTYHLTRLSH